MKEDTFEMAVIEQLTEIGWSYVPVAMQPVERDYRNPLFVERCRPEIERLPVNAKVPRTAMDEAFRLLENIDGAGLVQRNRQFMEYLQDGIPVRYDCGGEERNEIVQLVDYAHPDKNDFTVVNQWTVEGKQVKRPDVVLFVNGLPLVVIELKSPSREETDELDAYQQLQNYMQVIPELFVYNCFLVTSDMSVTRAGTITSPESRFMQWKSVDGEYEDNEIAKFDTFFRGLLSPRRLVDVVKNFICFAADERGDKKILAGYHQYFAVKKAVAKTKKACGYDGRAGVFWHTQGSGKSLSMVFYAKLVREALGSPTLVVLTDRNDLDEQLYGQFAKCEDFLRQKPVMAKSRKNLKELLEGRTANGIFFSTIQKFEEGDEPLTDRADVIVMADEAHRSHYGLVERMKMTRNEQGDLVAKKVVGCARIIRNSLPKATYIAFTGTPIDAKDRSTREVFGDYIDIYDMTQSVKDGATRPLYYESRVVKLKLKDEVLSLIDGEYEKLAAEDRADALTIERSKREMSELEVLLGHEKTVKALVKDIINHYETCRAGLLTGKAMVVAYSREIAVKIHDEVLRLRPDWRNKVKIVMTESNQDPVEWQKHTGDKRIRKTLAKQFKDDADPFKIAIVVDMWLTGFDVPSLATMYVYKPMVGHNLMQAIARVNRVYGDKEGGLIVDYIGIAAALKEAMRRYTGGKGRRRVPGGEIRETAYQRFVENLEICHDVFHGHDWQSRLKENALQQGKNITAALNWIIPPEKEKQQDRYLEHALKMHQALQLCGSLVTEDERTEASFFEAVRVLLLRFRTGARPGKVSLRELNGKVEELIKASVDAEGVLNIFTDQKSSVSIFSPAFLAELEHMKERNLAVEMLKTLIKEQLRKYRVTDLVKSERFSEMLHETFNRYVNGLIDNEKVIAELLRIAREIADAKENDGKLGLTEEEAAFYSAITKPRAIKDFYTNDQLMALTRELTDTLRKNRTIDWQRQESARARMRLMVKKLLAKYKYPPDDIPSALETVISQCELWADSTESPS